ncbi:MAG: saccharopine dehydrogenase family protein [Vicinamibacterales bacterium]
MALRTVLVIGGGIQGRAAIHDLERSPDVERVIAADIDLRGLEAHLAAIGARKTEAVAVDVRDRAQIGRLMSPDVGVAITLVPSRFERSVAEVAIERGTHLVTTNYAGAVGPLDSAARARGVTIVPEAGFDPGIDLVIVGRALAAFDRIDTLNSYGSGIPAPECRDTNVLRYKISWSWEGVLAAYWRPARLLVDGAEVVVPREAIFRPEWRHDVTVDDVGVLEAYVNGDAVAVAEEARLVGTLRTAGRYTLRWPGHCDFWLKVASLGLLDDAPGAGGGPSPRDFLARHLEPQLHYAAHERDMIILRVDVEGTLGGRRGARRYELVACRDLETGDLAMSRAVGGPASIVAQMVLSGAVCRRGVASPIRDVPVEPFFDALARRGLTVVERDCGEGGGQVGGGQVLP